MKKNYYTPVIFILLNLQDYITQSQLKVNAQIKRFYFTTLQK